MKVVSFDIWDTCMTRLCLDPKHVFRETARRIREGFVEAAEVARERAESIARGHSEGNECQFKEIEIQFARLTSPELARHWMDVELEVERSWVRPVVPVREKLQAFRQQGARIVFISDMYLPATLLKEWLVDFGFAHENDPVFVSGEHRSGKCGRLFDLVTRRLEIDADKKQWLHIGDKWLPPPFSPPSGPTQWLFQGPPAESKLLAVRLLASVTCGKFTV